MQQKPHMLAINFATPLANAAKKRPDLSYFEVLKDNGSFILISNMITHIFPGHKNSPLIKIVIFHVYFRYL